MPRPRKRYVQGDMLETVVYQCDRCQTKGACLRHADTLPEGWERVNGYIICDQCIWGNYDAS